MATKKRTQDEDVISRLADAGEEALRELVDLPRRIAVGVIHRVEARLHETADRVRGIDVLDRRIAELEKRMRTLEKPPARRRSTRTTRATRPRTQRPAPVEPAPVVEEPAPPDEAPGSEGITGGEAPGLGAGAESGRSEL